MFISGAINAETFNISINVYRMIFPRTNVNEYDIIVFVIVFFLIGLMEYKITVPEIGIKYTQHKSYRVSKDI